MQTAPEALFGHLTDLVPCPEGAFQIPHRGLLSEGVTALQLSLVIPTYNERENIAELIRLLAHYLDTVLPQQYELIVVDDNSPDQTWAAALAIAPQFPQLRVMRRVQERGLSSAVIRGWQDAQGEILGVIDADLQHPPETVLALWQKMQFGSSLAVASRHVEGGGVSDWGLLRRLLSRGAQVLGLLMVPGVVGQVSDPMSGFFMVQRTAIADVPLHPLGYKILLEVLGRGRVSTVAEVGYVFREREAGASKVTWKQYVQYLGHLMRLRSTGRRDRVTRSFPIGRFLRFGLVGFSGVWVDMSVFGLLREGLGWGLTRSAILSAEVAILNNFLWNDAWTFADIAQQQQGWSLRLQRFLKFNAICLSGLILHVLVLNVLFNGFHMNAYLAKLAAIAAVMMWNFWLNLKLSWRVTLVENKNP